MRLPEAITRLIAIRTFKQKIYISLLKTHKRSDPVVMNVRKDIEALDFVINIAEGVKNG